MGFYKDISPFYGAFFPLRKAKVEFFDSLFRKEGVGKVLELACGSGRLAGALTQRGYEVVAVDEEENLLRDKGASQFVVARMQELPFRKNQTFNAVICVGNSLPHLKNKEAVEEVLRTSNDLLLPNGLMCIQIINFAYVRSRGVLNLPELVHKSISDSLEVRLKRTYRVCKRRAEFQPVLKIGKKRKSYRIPMYPFEYNDLVELLTGLGLGNVTSYSDYNYSHFAPASPSVIVVAKKMKGY